MKAWLATALVSAGAVAGCSEPAPEPASPPVEMRRWGYASIEACRQDYPGAACEIELDFAALNSCLVEKDLSVCHAEALASGAAHAWGPWHALEGALPGDPGPGATALAGVSQAAATEQTTMRGGFGGGSDGASHSGG